MTWTLLVAISSLALPLGALLWAARVGGSASEYFLAVIIGLALGASNVWLLSIVADSTVSTLRDHPEFAKRIYLRLMYIGVLIWTLMASAVGYGITRSAMRLL